MSITTEIDLDSWTDVHSTFFAILEKNTDALSFVNNMQHKTIVNAFNVRKYLSNFFRQK